MANEVVMSFWLDDREVTILAHEIEAVALIEVIEAEVVADPVIEGELLDEH